jgi:hypothetical protein
VLVDQCLEARLVDELLIHLVPELLGDGVRLFNVPRIRASLETLDVSASGQVVNLRFRVAQVMASSPTGTGRRLSPERGLTRGRGDSIEDLLSRSHRHLARRLVARAKRGMRNLLGSLTEHSANEEVA